MNGDRHTNRGLVIFSLILIGLGALYGFYPLSIIGFLFLIPAFLVPSRPPPPRPQPKPEETRRVTPPSRRVEPARVQAQLPTPPMRMTQPAEQVRPVQPMQPMGSPLETRLEPSPALFPTTMFPSASSYMLTPATPVEARQEKPESRDELIEFAVLLAVLRLFSG